MRHRFDSLHAFPSWTLFACVCACVAGCGGGGGGGGQALSVTLPPSVGPAADVACAAPPDTAYAGLLRLELRGEQLPGALIEYRAAAEPWQPLGTVWVDAQTDRLHVITWDTDQEPVLAGRRVDGVEVRVETVAGRTARAGPFTVDNSRIPAVVAAVVPDAAVLRDTIPVTVTAEGDTVEPFSVELAYSTGDASYTCATVSGPNPVMGTGAHTTVFEWDSLADIPSSLHGPVAVKVRVVAASGRFAPLIGVREIDVVCDNRPAPRIDLPADVLSVFERRAAGGPGALPVETYASLAWSDAPLHLAAFPTFGGLAPRAAAIVALAPGSVAYLGTEDEVFEPPLVLAREAAVGTVQGPLAYTAVLPAHGEVEARTSVALLSARARVQVLGVPEDAHVLHVVDPSVPAQAALDLSASSFPELSGPYPYVAYAHGPDAPGAIIGMQVFVPGLGLAGLIAVDPVTGVFVEEHVLTAQVPRPGLSGGVLTDGSLSVWTIDARSGRPLAGVAVVVSQGELVLRARTGAAGRADFEGLAPSVPYAVVAGGRALAARGMVAARARCVVIPLDLSRVCDNELAITGGVLDSGTAVPVELPILLSTREDAVALQLSLAFDPEQVQIAGNGVCAAETCALTLRPPVAWGPEWAPCDACFWLEFSNTEGWLVAGLVFDFSASGQTIIPAGASRLHLLDLRVNGVAPVESTVRFVNGVRRQLSGGASPVQHNVVTTAGGMSQIPVGIPGLLTAHDAFPAMELLAEEGGELQRTAWVSAALADGETLSVTGATPVHGPGVVGAEVARYAMTTDALALRREGGVVTAAAASFQGGAGERWLPWRALAAGALVPCVFSGAAPVSFADGFTARRDLVVLGPAGAAGGASGVLEREMLEPVPQGVAFSADCPWFWALPSAAVVTLAAPGGAQSSVCLWDDAGAAAPAVVDFADPPALLFPPAPQFPGDTAAQGAPLRWAPVAGAAYHVVTVGDDTGDPLLELIVPGAEPSELVLPPLPAACLLNVRVPYTWFVAAVLCEGGAGGHAAALDMLRVARTWQRAAAAAARRIEWR